MEVQRVYTTNEEASLPMVLLKHNRWKKESHIAVTDIPGAFLHADMSKKVHMLHTTRVWLWDKSIWSMCTQQNHKKAKYQCMACR